ncbi:hypothetical protein BGZ99_003692 [Dissophora globulifera]|uniref:Transmembrane protein n=1 Tax=Dissophora globulifera TaxID=979702 RepID=A0A9P6RP21_9FUNG|nr:hypothetical protein BGZ99_003692 [Dissophora globulifera]
MDKFDDPTGMYTPDASESVSLFISLSCVSVMSLLSGRKTAGTKFGTVNYPRALVIGLYIVSWLFSLVAAMLVQTNNYNIISCRLSILACILLYALSKVLIYLFLIERVHIVTAIGVTRWSCTLFKFNMVMLLPYLGCFILAVIYRVAILADDGQCKIGLLKQAGIPLIAYDILVSSWYTVLFLRALISSTSMLQGPTKSKLREVARRTLMGSILALLLSCANISTLVYFNGHERGLICLASCTMDVTLNAITIHWVTSRSGSSSERGNTNRSPRGVGDSGQYAMQETDKVSHLRSHISVSIESYVEEYHQLHFGNPSNITDPR